MSSYNKAVLVFIEKLKKYNISEEEADSLLMRKNYEYLKRKCIYTFTKGKSQGEMCSNHIEFKKVSGYFCSKHYLLNKDNENNENRNIPELIRCPIAHKSFIEKLKKHNVPDSEIDELWFQNLIEHANKTCDYIFTKGELKDEICNNKISSDNFVGNFCNKHETNIPGYNIPELKKYTEKEKLYGYSYIIKGERKYVVKTDNIIIGVDNEKEIVELNNKDADYIITIGYNLEKKEE